MTTTRKRILVLAAGAGLLGGAFFLFRPAPAAVDLTTVTRGPLEVTIDEEVQTRVVDRYTITAPVAGRVARIQAREGDPVQPGTIVAWIFPSPLDARAHEQAAARVAETEDAQRAADAVAGQARAAYDQARRSCDRAQELAAQHLIAPEERERAELDETNRQRELESAQFRAQAAAHDVEVARSALLGGAREAVALRSPVRGQLLRVPDPSERVVAPGTPLLEIGDPRNIEIVTDLLSSDAVRVHPGDEMRVEGWGGDSALMGHVIRVEPSGFTKVSALGVEEQRVNVVGILNTVPAGLGDRFRVDVQIVVWRSPGVLQVPASALFRLGPTWAVFQVEDGRVHQRSVEVGHRSGFDVEVIGGLKAGATVIRDPGDQVVEGGRVRAR